MTGRDLGVEEKSIQRASAGVDSAVPNLVVFVDGEFVSILRCFLRERLQIFVRLLFYHFSLCKIGKKCQHKNETNLINKWLYCVIISANHVKRVSEISRALKVPQSDQSCNNTLRYKVDVAQLVDDYEADEQKVHHERISLVVEREYSNESEGHYVEINV